VIILSAGFFTSSRLAIYECAIILEQNSNNLPHSKLPLMKKLIALFTCVLLLCHSHASSVLLSPPKLNSRDVLVPVGKLGNKISVFELSRISTSDFQQLTGEKMSPFSKFSFKLTQHKLRQNINQDGTFSRKAMARFFGGETGFHFGGFALGFFLGLIGLLIAYLIKDDYKPNRVKWAWIGFGIGVVISLVIALTSAPAVY